MVEIPGMSPSIDPSKGIRPRGAARTGPTEGGKSFEDYLTTKLEEVNNLQIKAEDAQQQLADGKTDDVTSVVMAVRKADLAFKALMEIRNKLVDAYQEVMRARG